MGSETVEALLARRRATAGRAKSAGPAENVPTRSGGSEDYAVSLGWRIGPGGLFDVPRIKAADARFRAAGLTADKTRDGVIGEVVDAQTQVVSLRDQIDQAARALDAAAETLK